MKKIQLSVLASLLIVLTKTVSSQISFLHGNTLNLVSSEAIIYLETRIIFNTGKYNIDDYKWEKVSDSLDKNWFVTACFNGDCKNDLLQSGQFIKDFGLNDTTGFIAFHVESKGNIGKSIIKYNVINTKNQFDMATLTFNISYSTSTFINEIVSQNLITIYPNPSSNDVTISNPLNKMYEIKITNMHGKIIENINSKDLLTSICTNKDMYPRGIYFIQFINSQEKFIEKLIINN